MPGFVDSRGQNGESSTKQFAAKARAWTGNQTVQGWTWLWVKFSSDEGFSAGQS
jgi:hypothetical protein